MKSALLMLLTCAAVACDDPAAAEPSVDIVNESGASVVYALVVHGSLVDPVPSLPYSNVDLPRLDAGESRPAELTAEFRDQGFTTFVYFPRPAGAPTEWRLEATVVASAADVEAGADVVFGSGTAIVRR